MRIYKKPTLDIVELRTREAIATSYNVPASTFKKGANGWSDTQLKQMALQSLDEDNISNL